MSLGKALMNKDVRPQGMLENKMTLKSTNNANFSPKMQSLIERWKLCRELELEALQSDEEKPDVDTSLPINISFSTLYGLRASSQARAQNTHAQNEVLHTPRKITSPAA